MVTAALYVILPRLLLAFASSLRTERLKRRLPLEHDFYVRRVVRDAVGAACRVRVVSYGFEPSGEAPAKLKRLVAEVLGDKATFEVEAPVAYGHEDEWLSAHGHELTHSDQLILLFNLASTPEAENHGAMLSGVRQRLSNAVELLVLLDDSAFVHRHRGQASVKRRLDERLNAWRAVLARSNVEPIRVSLDHDEHGDAARALERTLLRGTALA
jgi:hypothetical protein